MTNEKCEWHAKGIWTEGLCYCSGCCSELFEATALCQEAMRFVVDELGRPDIAIEVYVAAFEEKKRAEWRNAGGVGKSD